MLTTNTESELVQQIREEFRQANHCGYHPKVESIVKKVSGLEAIRAQTPNDDLVQRLAADAYCYTADGGNGRREVVISQALYDEVKRTLLLVVRG